MTVAHFKPLTHKYPTTPLLTNSDPAKMDL